MDLSLPEPWEWWGSLTGIGADTGDRSASCRDGSSKSRNRFTDHPL
jgi:hypothetical protein